MMRLSFVTLKRLKWSTIGAILGALVAAAGLVKTGVELWKGFHPRLLESRFILLKGDCLYKFIKNNARPEDEFGIAKPMFVDSIGLLNNLRESLSRELATGSSTESAVFLLLRNISGEQAEKIVIHARSGEGYLTRVGPGETILICISLKHRGTEAQTILVDDVNFIPAHGLNQRFSPGPIPLESQMIAGGAHGCGIFGYQPGRRKDD